jgi:protein TonB
MATALTPSGRGLAVAVFLSAAAHAGTLLIAGSPTEPVGGTGGGAGMSVQLAAAGGAPETGSASEGDEGEATPPSPEDDTANPSAEAADQGEPSAPEPTRKKAQEAPTHAAREDMHTAEASTPARPEMAEPSVKEPPSEAASATSREEEAARPVNEEASTDPAPEADRDASGASGGSGEPEVDRGHLRAQASDALKGHFRYPPVAIRRGWEGEVRLAFRVTAEGEIRDVHVTRGSGHGMLDNAAREALQRVARLKAPGHAVELELPVHFRLREG